MFKKLASLLFEEEEEILEETVAEPVKKKPSVITSMNPSLKPEEKPVEIIPVSDEKARLNFGITADDTEDIDDVVQKVRPIRVEPVKAEIKRKLYDFHPVISPIFGVKESSLKDTSARVIPESQPILPRSIINTVISPIYGDMEASAEIKHVSLSDFNPSTTKPEAAVVSKSDVEKVSVDKEKYERLDLDALLNTLNDEDDKDLNLEPKLTPIFEDDAHQFSLFDDLK